MLTSSVAGARMCARDDVRARGCARAKMCAQKSNVCEDMSY